MAWPAATTPKPTSPVRRASSFPSLPRTSLASNLPRGGLPGGGALGGAHAASLPIYMHAAETLPAPTRHPPPPFTSLPPMSSDPDLYVPAHMQQVQQQQQQQQQQQMLGLGVMGVGGVGVGLPGMMGGGHPGAVPWGQQALGIGNKRSGASRRRKAKMYQVR